jgi:hypothetical protein
MSALNGGTVPGCCQRVGYSLRSAQPTRPPCGRVATGARDCSAGLLAGILECTVGALAPHLIPAIEDDRPERGRDRRSV